MYVVTMNIKDSNSPQKIKIINVLEGTTAEVITRSNSLGQDLVILDGHRYIVIEKSDGVNTRKIEVRNGAIIQKTFSLISTTEQLTSYNYINNDANYFAMTSFKLVGLNIVFSIYLINIESGANLGNLIKSVSYNLLDAGPVKVISAYDEQKTQIYLSTNFIALVYNDGINDPIIKITFISTSNFLRNK